MPHPATPHPLTNRPYRRLGAFFLFAALLSVAAVVASDRPARGSTPPPVAEANGAGSAAAAETPLVAAEITGGFYHTCARLDNGAAKCWGLNDAGQLGMGDTNQRGDGPGEMGNSLPPVDLGTGRKAVELKAGGEHTCARLDNGAVKCWGLNDKGQLGVGDSGNRGDGPGEMGDNLPAVNLGTGRTAVALTAGRFHTCARLDDGAVKCWGLNEDGQLGIGDTNNRGDDLGEMGNALPSLDLGTGRTAVELKAGGFHTCARLDNGAAKCWGHNLIGQLGRGDTSNRGDGPGEMGDNLLAVELGTGRTAVALAPGRYHTCARLDNGAVKCWGLNKEGELGMGDTNNRGDGPGEMGDALPALDLGTGRAAVELKTGGGYHNCARLDNGAVKCWGHNLRGQLGRGDTDDRGDGPGEMGDNLPAVNLGTGRTVTQLWESVYTTCARLDNGAVKCWGRNDSGQMGIGDTNNRGDNPGEMGDALPVLDLGTAPAPVRYEVIVPAVIKN